jgi:hypothetical protein
LPYFWSTKNVDIDKGKWAYIREKNNVDEMKNEKNYMGPHIPKVWQILERFAGTFHQA